MSTTFIEKDCTIEHEGKKFTSGGAWLADCTDGYRRGVVYAKPEAKYNIDKRSGEPAHAVPGAVTDWHGNIIASAAFGPIYRGNMCRMRSVTFDVDGVKFTGRYCPDTSEAVRVRSTKRVS